MEQAINTQAEPTKLDQEFAKSFNDLSRMLIEGHMDEQAYDVAVEALKNVYTEACKEIAEISTRIREIQARMTA